MVTRRITKLITFNDSCPRSRIAHKLAAELGIDRHVLEEGYLRPWWVTFDWEGVNGNTVLPKCPAFYRDQNTLPVAHQSFRQSFRYLVRDTILHFSACTLMSPVLPYDPRYYGDSVMRQGIGYTGEYIWRKTHSEAGVLKQLRHLHTAGARIFVALMQKPGDAQLRFHSHYHANNPYLTEIIGSFAQNADPNAVLVVKQHPLDYGIEKSRKLFRHLVRKHGLEGRAYYIRTLTIESVLELAAGLVTVNSTGGMASIERLIPTITLGKAIYDIPDITFQGGIGRFWTECTPPDAVTVTAFLNYLKSHTQVNGGFYSRRSLKLLTRNLAQGMVYGGVAPHFAAAIAQRERVALTPAFQALPAAAI
jgi:capsular polysaccharide export protein